MLSVFLRTAARLFTAFLSFSKDKRLLPTANWTAVIKGIAK
jgi:hypothetical protein